MVGDDDLAPPIDPEDVQLDQEKLLRALKLMVANDHVSLAEAPQFLARGAEAVIHTFRLENAPPGFDGPLILRCLLEHKDADQLIWEGAVHQALEGGSLPVPRVFHVETDASVLGWPFLIAERVPGDMLLGELMKPDKLGENIWHLPALIRDAVFRVPLILADTLLHLHSLNPLTFRESLDASGFSPDRISFRKRLGDLKEKVEAANIDGVLAGLAWLQDNYSIAGVDSKKEVICHGDLLFTNLHVIENKVTGVFDWSSVTLADPAYDLAATFSRLKSHIPNVPAWLKPIMRPLQVYLTRRFIRRYTRQNPLDSSRLDYYEAYWILSEIVVGQAHLQSGARFDGSLENRWLHPATIEVGMRDFKKLTGVTLGIIFVGFGLLGEAYQFTTQLVI
jgi:aminoglycoside phosphotransferase (APT) family kinase protein